MTGNMLIAQSGGPSMVINQSLVGAILAAKGSDKIVEIYGALHGIQGIFDEAFINLRAEPDEVLLRVAQTPSSALGSVRRKPTADDCRAIFEILARRNIRYLISESPLWLSRPTRWAKPRRNCCYSRSTKITISAKWNSSVLSRNVPAFAI